MRDYQDHLIHLGTPIRSALERLDKLASDAILFAVDQTGVLIGSMTDGDVRRGFIRGLSTDDTIDAFIKRDPKYLVKGDYSIHEVIELRNKLIFIVPVIDQEKRIINVVNFNKMHSYLPVDAVIMAGGRGSRLKPLTDKVPKPLLKVGEKPIIEHNMDRLIKFGIDDFWISIRYLGQQLEDYFKDGGDKKVSIQYVNELDPLGTLGAAAKIDDFTNDYVLITNSDILTDMDYEDFFLDFIERGADMAVVTIPYQVDVPYAVMETNNNHVLSFKEKPTYTYYSNGGIYLLKRELLEMVPKNSFYNSTDLMEEVIDRNMKLISFPISQYWLDIGKPEDFAKAQEDIKRLKL